MTNNSAATPINTSLRQRVDQGAYVDVLNSLVGKALIEHAVGALVRSQEEYAREPLPSRPDTVRRAEDAAAVGLAALNAFLQVNVTGPVLEDARAVQKGFEGAYVVARKQAVGNANGVEDGAALAGQLTERLRRDCLHALEVDGVSPYAYIPHVELFWLAWWTFTRGPLEGVKSVSFDDAERASDLTSHPVASPVPNGATGQLAYLNVTWTRLRIHAWHYKLLTQPSLGPGSTFTRSSQWSDVPTLAGLIDDLIDQTAAEVLGEEVWSEGPSYSRAERAEFLVEKANYLILLGKDDKARETIRLAAEESGLQYALSGALGKRTKFQVNSTSQLVVLARSADRRGTAELDRGDEAGAEHDGKKDERQEAPGNDSSKVEGETNVEGNTVGLGQSERPGGSEARPQALALNNDTLLEEIAFTKSPNGGTNGKAETSNTTLPASLAELEPDSQPQLSPLDQIILLTEATLKDSFSPVDTLTAEEVLPYAVRVLADKSTNWQIYTQALLVRSRIEVHRSRTVERGVLQMQAVVDQVIVDTSSSDSGEVSGKDEGDNQKSERDTNATEVPVIEVTAPDATPPAATMQPSTERQGPGEDKPTSFFRAAAASESAPAHVRLQYIHILASPPRWHLESELAYAWAGVGSLISALEIFKRLRLWAEVALCLASAGAADDEDGRGAGGEDKARAIVRWRLFHRTGDAVVQNADPDTDVTGKDVTALSPQDFYGPERTPSPPNAPRLFCILGDLENEPAHYERAWQISNRRFARAQKSLGEHYLAQKDWSKAQAAYKLAVGVNRLSPELWSRLGDISLRLGEFADAVEAFGRAIGAAGDVVGGEDARTWSNLGSALWSLYLETAKEDAATTAESERVDDDTEIGSEAAVTKATPTRDPATLLTQSLAAYKRGATISQDNWRIWDNVLTLASRVHPPAIPEMVQALRAIIRIRGTEAALDEDLLRLLLQEAVLSRDKDPSAVSPSGGVYIPPRGTTEKLVTDLFETSIRPLITSNSALWELLGRLAVWKGDYAAAVDAAEKAWRAAIGGASGGTSLAPSSGGGDADWLTDKEAWGVVVARTDELVSALENWGPRVENIGERWKGKARSAVRSVMGKGKENWEGSEGWTLLEGLMDGLKR